MTKAKRATNRSPTRERVSPASVYGGYHPPVSLSDYDDEDGLLDPDFESELHEQVRTATGGGFEGDPKPLYKIFK